MVPILARFRQLYEQSSLPLGRLCLRLGLTPDMLTYLSLAFGALAGYCISQRQLILGVLFILLMGFADVLDGATARAGGIASDFGTLLDHVTDRYAECLILGGVMLSGLVQPAWVLFAIFGMVMASYARARAEASGRIRSCNVGFAGRQEKLGLLIIGLIIQPTMIHLPVLEWIIIAVGVASHITVIQRMAYARRILLEVKTPLIPHPGSEQG